MTDRQFFIDGIKAFFATLIVLWVLDVVVNLSIIQELYIGHQFHAGPKDYIGLFMAEIQIAFAAVVVCWIIGWVVGVLSKTRYKTGAAVILLASLVSAMTVFITVHNAWRLATLDIRVAAAIALVIGVLTWLVLHAKVRELTVRITFGETTQLVLFPPLILGLVVQVLAQLTGGRIEAAVLNSVVALIMIAIVTSLAIFRFVLVTFVLRWLPFLAAVFLAGLSVVTANSYGVNNDIIHRDPTLKRPHIILIVLDTVRADHLRRFGHPYDTMPTLEKWADNALCFTRTVSPAGWTTPAHASFLSGLPVSLHGVHYGSETGVFFTKSFEGINWLPERLAERGYYCLAVNANPLALPDDITGFKRVLEPSRREWSTSTMAGFVDDEFALFRRMSERLRWRMPYVDAGRIVDITMRAVPKGDGPVFLFVNLLDAHSPYNPPEEALGLLGVRPPGAFSRYSTHHELTMNWSLFPNSKQKSLSQLYDGELRWIDHHLERMLPWIEERYGHDAVVIVTSDHGEELGEKGRVGHEFGLSQSLIHVPLFVKGPNLSAGEIDDIVSLRGLYRFMVSVASGEEPDIATIAHPDTFGIITERYPSGRSVELYGNEYERAWVALFENEMKAVGPSEFGLGFFDVTSLGFKRDVEVSSPPDSTRLQGRIDGYWETHRDRREETEFGEVSAETIRKLRSLGYVK